MAIPFTYCTVVLQNFQDLRSTLTEKADKVECDLEDLFRECLCIEESPEFEYTVDRNYGNDVKEKGTCEGPEVCQKKPSRKCLDKSATFPSSGMVLPHTVPPSGEEELETSSNGLFSEEHLHQAYSRSVSFPTPPKLVSAMKGSRAQRGLPREKLTVKWDPDVYDPPQTSLSHTLKSKKQSNTKNKKNGRKCRNHSNSSRRSGDKDKKQAHKLARN